MHRLDARNIFPERRRVRIAFLARRSRKRRIGARGFLVFALRRLQKIFHRHAERVGIARGKVNVLDRLASVFLKLLQKLLRMRLFVSGCLLKKPRQIFKTLFSRLLGILRIALARLALTRKRTREILTGLCLHEIHKLLSFCCCSCS